jgi:crotonobetainyl-CoA:carnitine CoA-transferase CaiB-like acyl-CoA transferase
MKTIAKAKTAARRRTATHARPASTKPTAEEFRRRMQIELADEIAAAQANFTKTHGHLLRAHTAAEVRARGAAARAMFAQWEKEDRKDPPATNDWGKFKALLEKNRMRSAPIFAE